MANFKNIAMAIMMVVVAFFFASCENCDEADILIKGNGIQNGGNTDPEDPNYELVTEHVSSMVADMKVLDDHKAILKKDGRVVEENPYTVTNEVKVARRTILRSVANRLSGTTVENGTVVDEEGNTVEVTITRKECGYVTFKENGKTYCHKDFPVDGGIVALGCCDLKAPSVKFGAVIEDRLPVTANVVGDETKPVPAEEWIVVDDPVHGYEVDDFATVTGNNESSLNVYPTIDGERTGEVIVVKGAFNGSLKAGAQIEKTSKGAIRLNNTAANMNNANANFTYTLDGVSFSDVWAWSASSEALFTLPDGTSVVKPIQANYTVSSTSFTANNGIYSNAATLYAGEIAIASDVQLIKVNAPLEPTYPGWKATYTSQWAITRVYDRNATRNLVVLTGTMMNESNVIAGFHIVLDGQAAANELPTQLQPLSAPSFTTPFSLFFNSRTSSWEYGSLRFANKGKINTTWDYTNWNVTNNQPMSVNISQDVADDVVWLNDNIVVKNGVVSFSYNGKNYTIVSDTF